MIFLGMSFAFVFICGILIGVVFSIHEEHRK